MPEADVALVGRGILYNAVEAALVPRTTSDGPAPALTGCDLLISVCDGWDTRDHASIRRMCRARRIPWFPVRAELGRAVIGPVEVPGAVGCARCADLRRDLIRQESAGFGAIRRRHRALLAERPSSWLTIMAADLIAAIVADETARLRSPSAARPARIHNALLYVALDTLAISRHPFLHDPTCPECATLTADTAEAASIEFITRPKFDAGDDRIRPTGGERERLNAIYLDEETGLVRITESENAGGLIMTTAVMGRRGASPTLSTGRGGSRRTSEATALFEALERHGARRTARRTPVRGRFRDLRSQAIDPRDFGLYPDERYALPNFPFRRFDEDTDGDWTWAYSFVRREPVLIPLTFGYYGLDARQASDPGFAYESSNGCALGGCLEEAVLHGALEVAERDALLLTWHARLPAPRIDLRSSPDPRVPLLAATIERDTGYEIRAFNTTVEPGIPCVAVFAVHPGGKDRNDGNAKVICAGGANLDPARALFHAVREIAGVVTFANQVYAERRWRTPLMAGDPSFVRALEDHVALCADPAVYERFRFLLDDREQCGFAETFSRVPRIRNTDLRADAEEVIGRYLNAGLDVVVVDQTAPEHHAGALRCVKVQIPGTLPLTFGHDHRRLHGLPRLYDMPRMLGYQDQPLRPEDVNHHPHPIA